MREPEEIAFFQRIPTALAIHLDSLGLLIGKKNKKKVKKQKSHTPAAQTPTKMRDKQNECTNL